MLLAVDAGNTNIVFAVYGDTGIAPLHVWRSRTDSTRTADEYAGWLLQMFALHNLDRKQIRHAMISSVVPDANFHLNLLCQTLFGIEAAFIGQKGLDTGVVIDLPHPEQLGADRIVNTVAMLADYPYPALVIDFGTATTFDVINEQGHFCGGVIAPGANLSMAALHQAAAQLPKVSVNKPPAVIGTDTVSAMQSGIYWGYIGLIEGMVQRISTELGQKPFVLATGGLAGLFAGDTDCIDKIDSDLTLRGLLYLHRKATISGNV
ncbi:MAG: type III pantothenate kinase [Micavibrio sp.]